MTVSFVRRAVLHAFSTRSDEDIGKRVWLKIAQSALVAMSCRRRLIAGTTLDGDHNVFEGSPLTSRVLST